MEGHDFLMKLSIAGMCIVAGLYMCYCMCKTNHSVSPVIVERDVKILMNLFNCKKINPQKDEGIPI